MSAIAWSVIAGAALYVYCAWLADDRDNPRDARKVFRESIGILLFAVAFAVLLLLPWALFEGWSLKAVVLADLPYRKMRSAVYAVYAAVTAGGIGILHSAVAKLSSRSPG